MKEVVTENALRHDWNREASVARHQEWDLLATAAADSESCVDPGQDAAWGGLVSHCRKGLTGKILNSISEAGFKISALEMFNVDPANAEEFYEVYKGVVTEYPSMVTELCSGPCMVLEIHGTDVSKSFREFCGPSDPEIARHLRPNTLRALYGKDKVKNAVHCTDLPEDGGLEVQYFFKILDG
ncbi:Nucleoside diphosphate kinase 7 [Characodon lateralis]|uniref:Nucleoside diphosphate kinase B n=1 Tax=Characodon lateralis TaxID=208331 RepID=A0ABU7E6Z7_9TELE|nr:Nucleoside diphosphate kinase 7 [Characodon lateralis]